MWCLTCTTLWCTYASQDGSVQEGFDTVLLAIGRKPETGRLNLQAAGVEITERSHHVKVPIAALHIEDAHTE